MAKKSFKEKFYEKHPGLFLLFSVANKVRKRDSAYVNRVFSLDSDPDYIKLEHAGEKNPGEVEFIIRDLDRSVGFCAVIVDTIKKLVYAEDLGFKPAIIYSDNFLYFDPEKDKEIKNPFEYYFLPVGSKDCLESMNIVNAAFHHGQYSKLKYKIDAYEKENFYNSKLLMNKAGKVISKYLQIKPEILADYSAMLKEFQGKKVVGLHYRGTDYKVGYNMHPVQVTKEQSLALVEKRLNEDGYDAIFLATDDKAMSADMKERYAGKVFMYEDVYRSDSDVSVAFSEDDRAFHHYKLGYEILRDMYTLSICDGLIAGKSHVSFLSQLYKLSSNKEYEHLDILDNGSNSNDNNFYDSVKELKNLK